MIEVEQLTKHYGAGHRHPRRVLHRRARPDRRLPRPQRRREVDDHAHPRLLHAGHRRARRGSPGYDVFRESMEVRRRIGYMPENVPLYPDMRVAPYLDFVAEVKGVSRAERRRRVADVMDRCLIADVQNRLIGKLSRATGSGWAWRRRSSAIPTCSSSTSPPSGSIRSRSPRSARSSSRSPGEHTVILSTHILPEVSMVCSGVIIINKGAIVAQGPIDTLVEQFFPTARVRGRDRRPAVGGPRSDPRHPGRAVGRRQAVAGRRRALRGRGGARP